MIKPVNFSNNIKFKAQAEEKKEEAPVESRLLPNTLNTRVRQKFQKTTNAFLQYPVKGLKGDVNSDFYEFLSMGIIPYLVGSGMFMLMFNLLHDLKPKSQKIAGLNGKNMALGVVMYGLGKTLSNDLVTRPVYWGTGVDTELPIEHVYYPLPKNSGESANIEPQIQQRKVYDSVEFFRKDLIQSDPKYGVKYYDNIAKKLNMGDNLNDSVTETTPIIQGIVSSTKTAKSLASYAWAGTAVMLAVQDSWSNFFDAISNRKRHIAKPNEGFGTKISARMKNAGENFVDISKTFGKSFTQACKTLWTGKEGTTGFMKHAGKAWLLFSTALTVGSVANVIYRAKSMGKLANKDIMDKDKESTVI